jgi:RNA 2',3'-cyclic 3'-phosphodiesterase
MVRLFVAARPPERIRSQILALMQGIEGARWQDDDQLHLTLRFIGEVGLWVADEVVLALRKIRADQPNISLSGVGTFARRGRIDTLWAGIAQTGDLAALHRKIDHALVRIGLAPEGRTYKPHITIARFGKMAGDTGSFVRAHGDLVSPTFPIDTFHLFESTLGGSGAHYRMAESFTLGP